MTLAAEWIKLSTTRSPAWLAAAATVLSLGLAAIQPSAKLLSGHPLPPERAAIGVATFGVPVLMILAAMTVTAEYRTGTIRTTFMATPNRTKVLCAKAVLAAAVAGVSAAVMVIASIALARALASEHVGARLSLAQAATWRPVGALALYAALGAVLAVSLGVLLRHAAAVVAVLLMMPFVIEPVLGSLPRVGDRLGPVLPFVNAYLFTEVPWWFAGVPWWGPLGALLYFCGVVAVAFLAAVLVINRRDP
jgi:ABC-2 type transport system permease protein